MATAEQKRKAAKALEKARQTVRELGDKVTNTDRKRVADAEAAYNKIKDS